MASRGTGLDGDPSFEQRQGHGVKPASTPSWNSKGRLSSKLLRVTSLLQVRADVDPTDRSELCLASQYQNASCIHDCDGRTLTILYRAAWRTNLDFANRVTLVETPALARKGQEHRTNEFSVWIFRLVAKPCFRSSLGFGSSDAG